MFKLPVPIHHELDGGRYIGTACAVITQDPDSGWINAGTYRIQVVEPDVGMCYISPGKHGRLHRDKYFERGLPCPAVAVVGIDPSCSWPLVIKCRRGFQSLIGSAACENNRWKF